MRPGQRGREGVERCFVGQVGRHKSAARVGAVFHAGFVQPVIHGRAQGSLDGSQIDAVIDLNDGRAEKKLLRAGREQAGVIRRDPGARRRQGSADGIPPKAFVGIVDGSPAAAALKLPCGAGHHLQRRGGASARSGAGKRKAAGRRRQRCQAKDERAGCGPPCEGAARPVRAPRRLVCNAGGEWCVHDSFSFRVKKGCSGGQRARIVSGTGCTAKRAGRLCPGHSICY